jgi:hypothetical protein
MWEEGIAAAMWEEGIAAALWEEGIETHLTMKTAFHHCMQRV